MSWRPRHILVGLLAALSASMGCRCWECGILQRATLPPQTASSPAVAEPLSSLQTAQLCRRAGEELENKGFADEAIRQYENARKHDPRTSGVARHLAVLYDLQDNPAAESEYQRALQEQPHGAELLNDFGYFHYRHHRLPDAETWLRNALAVNPQCACAWINLGRVLADQGRAQESFQAFAHVLRPAEAYSNVGVLLARQGRAAEARAALRQAIALDPGLEQPRAFLNALPSAPDRSSPNVTLRSTTASTPATKPACLPPPVTPAPLPCLAPSKPQPTQADAAPNRPVIVNGPIQTTTNYAPTSAWSKFNAKTPNAPRTTPTPAPAAPRPTVSEEGPLLIRTGAWLDEPGLAEPSAPPSPHPLPSPPPQATLLDCQPNMEASPLQAP